MIGAKLIEAAGSGIATGEVAEAVDFDGTNDYLIKNSDLTGNSNNKTFTFSVWLWDNVATSGSARTIYTNFNGSTYMVEIRYASTDGYYQIICANSSGTTILDQKITALSMLKDTWNNIIVSFDLANASNRWYSVNDVTGTPSSTTYTNDTIAFDSGIKHTVSANQAGSGKYKGRLAHVYLDYTYRDLSVEANRRLFVTADLKPADGQASLNPILYLPMDDPTQPGLNAGTGGNFTLNGTIARSGRGPNQYNAPYSYFNRANSEFLRCGSTTGLSDGKTFTFSCVFKNNATTNEDLLFEIQSGSVYRFRIGYSNTGVYVQGKNSSGTIILSSSTVGTQYRAKGNNHVVISVDMANTANRHIYINGIAQSPPWGTYSNENIDFTSADIKIGVSSAGPYYIDGNVGAVWFNTSYIDLSQPANLAKFVTGTGIDAKPVDLGANGELPTGTAPKVYLPMYANNPGKNYGTMADFTGGSTTLVGARGPNEFWGNWADFNGTSSKLSKTSAIAGDSNQISGSFFVKRDTSTAGFVFTIIGSGGTQGFEIYINAAGDLSMYSRTSSPSTVLDLDLTGAFPSTATVYSVQYCFDYSNSAKRFIYINGVQKSPTYNTYTNGNGYYSAPRPTIGARWSGTAYQSWIDGQLSEFYFTTSYIDFSQEANRLKFRDAFGNPVNLTQQIEDAAIPNPAIYMRFDPASFGTNSGTGGNLTVTSINDGGQL